MVSLQDFKLQCYKYDADHQLVRVYVANEMTEKRELRQQLGETEIPKEDRLLDVKMRGSPHT